MRCMRINPHYFTALGAAIFGVLMIAGIVLFATEDATQAAWALLFGFVYFLPSLLAWRVLRVHVLLATNAMLGFTVVGWIVCWIWLLAGERWQGPGDQRILDRDRENDRELARRMHM